MCVINLFLNYEIIWDEITWIMFILYLYINVFIEDILSFWIDDT